MIAHITLLHMSIEAHAQDPYSEFHSITVRAHRLLWSLLLVSPWVEFRYRYHDFMMTGNSGLDRPRFQAQGAWTTLTIKLLLREEFELRGITMETLQFVFPLHQVYPPLVSPAPAQGPPSLLTPAQGPPIPPAPDTSLMPDTPGKAHVVIDIPDTPDLVVISSSSRDEDHQGEEDDPEKDDPEEDQDSVEMGIEQPEEQEADELMVYLEEKHEPQVQQKIGNAESEASTSSFDQVKNLMMSPTRITIHLRIVRWF